MSVNETVGNAAAMCEALKDLQFRLVAGLYDGSIDCHEALEVVEKALALPRRNCDVGTAEEQAERFILFCLQNSFRGVCNNSCRFANVNRRLGWQEIGQARCFPFWAQMPYEAANESEAK